MFKNTFQDFQGQPGASLLGTLCTIPSGNLCLLDIVGVVKTKKLSPALGAITASPAHIHTQFAARQFADQWDLHMEEPLFVNRVLQMKANSLM